MKTSQETAEDIFIDAGISSAADMKETVKEGAGGQTNHHDAAKETKISSKRIET